MNIALLSSTSSYHFLGRLLEKDSTVYQFGASSRIEGFGNYIPVHTFLPQNKSVDDLAVKFLDYSKDKKIDFVMGSGLAISRCPPIHQGLTERNIPYFFVNWRITDLERDKSLSKQLLTKIGIPTPKYQKADGAFLFENFKTIPRPFVIKLNLAYRYGRQTIIVKEENWEEVYNDLFSHFITGTPRPANIEKTTSLLIEEYVKLKREYSYHALFNKVSWRYLGSARDYKTIHENDQGHNTFGVGAYSVNDIDPIVHEYADKIYNFLKIYLGPSGDFYRGFIFLGIGVDQNNVPHILEINTRSGDPELPTILGNITNNLSELFYSASANLPIPEVTHSNQKTVTIRVFKKTYNWSVPATSLPNFSAVPDDIIRSIDGGPTSDTGKELQYLKDSVFTTSRNTRQEAASALYRYLNSQELGEFTFRRDVGILE